MSTNQKSPGAAQSVIRRGRMRADRFVQVSNDLARDRRLSRRARGLFVELASHQEGWQTSIAALVELGPEGVHAIRGAVEELEKYGYLVRTQHRDPATGRLGETDYWITDCPEEYQAASAEPSSENRTTDDATDLPSSEPPSGFPMSAEPHADEPRAEDRTHKKTNPQKTNERNQEMPPSSASPAGKAQQQDLLGVETPPTESPNQTAQSSKAKKERTPEEQLRFDLANEVATAWWERCDTLNLPNIRRGRTSAFPGLRQMVESALAGGCSVNEIKWALDDIRERFPTVKRLENAIARRRGVAAPQKGGGRPVNNRHLQAVPEGSAQAEQQDERREMFG
ncbi:hypothetical protein ACIBKY_03350 [Nonomuraea sp. NPDC050394]|uniref:hypothetical protein n=1 Tax=Nonomuraea sp. NPDC050394 TaxID=3364363 RepID=UPI0037AC9C84